LNTTVTTKFISVRLP